ncbi:hypothetical protein D5086_004367 [Populus alba]|uniref:Uncharacterized protein n=1 Tax=Populus alba TaxID=43335 RepID=A0ACC4CQA9_POPAL
MMLGRLEEEGNVNVEDIRPVLHTVLLELANVKTAMGRREEAIYNFKKCLEMKEMLWRKEEKNWVWIWGTGGGLCCSSEFQGGIAVWFEGIGEQNALSRKVLMNWGLSSELLNGEIDAANMGIELGKYDEFINTLKGVVQQTEKDSWTQALVFISMAKAPCNLEKFADAKRCLEIACGILDKKETASAAEVAGAYSEIAMQYETRDRFETAISLLKRTLSMLEKLLQEQHAEENSSAIIGWLLLLTCKVT